MCAANSRHVRAARASSRMFSCSKMSSLHSAGIASQPPPPERCRTAHVSLQYVRSTGVQAGSGAHKHTRVRRRTCTGRNRLRRRLRRPFCQIHGQQSIDGAVQRSPARRADVRDDERVCCRKHLPELRHESVCSIRSSLVHLRRAVAQAEAGHRHRRPASAPVPPLLRDSSLSRRVPAVQYAFFIVANVPLEQRLEGLCLSRGCKSAGSAR